MEFVLTICLDWLHTRGLVASATTNRNIRRLAEELTEKRVRELDFAEFRGLFGEQSWKVHRAVRVTVQGGFRRLGMRSFFFRQ